MALAWLDETGLHLPDYQAVKTRLENAFRSIYGDDLYLEPDSQDGQLLAIFAEALTDAYDLVGAVYNSYAPSTAQGVSLSRQVAINGIRRAIATHSTVDLRIIGSHGTLLNRAVATDNQQRRWLIPDGIVIPQSGEITVTARAEDVGALAVPAGDITTIATPIRGWHSVTNPSAASTGAPVETDPVLRRRQSVSTARPSRTVVEGIWGAIAEVPGVTRYRVYENDTNAVDVNGVPAHSISAVVEGGENTAIAHEIALRKTPGCGTHGDQSIPVVDRYGTPVTIKFWRCAHIEITAEIEIQPLPGYLDVTGAKIKQQVVAHINDLGIGKSVLSSRLYNPINDADGMARTFDVLGIALFANGVRTGVNAQIPFHSAAFATIDGIKIEVVG